MTVRHGWRNAVLMVGLLAASALPAVADETSPNVAPEGFTALFNGRNLDGWQGLVGTPLTRAKMSADERAAAQKAADEKMRAHWSVVDGVLTFDGGGENLCTVRDFGDFELLLDWKIEPKGDSGIYLRGTPQVQIWDFTEAGGHWKLGADKGSGGLWNNSRGKPGKDPALLADRPVGEWNTFRIRLVGDRCTVDLNGKRVVDNAVLENYWDRSRPLLERGPIELQNHGTRLYFRNLFVRELAEDAAP